MEHIVHKRLIQDIKDIIDNNTYFIDKFTLQINLGSICSNKGVLIHPYLDNGILSIYVEPSRSKKSADQYAILTHGSLTPDILWLLNNYNVDGENNHMRLMCNDFNVILQCSKSNNFKNIQVFELPYHYPSCVLL